MIVLRSKSFAKFKAKDLTPEIENTLREVAGKKGYKYDGFLEEFFTKPVHEAVKKPMPVGKMVKLNNEINSPKAKKVRAVREAIKRAGI